MNIEVHAKRLWFVYLVLLCGGAGLENATAQQPQEQPDTARPVVEAELGQTRNVHRCGNLFLAGQFIVDDLDKIKAAGIERIISLRTEGEISWDEPAAVEQADLKFINVPFRSPDSLNDEIFDNVRKLLADRKTATLFHCGSANRVGAVWLPYRVLDEGVAIETALDEAHQVGLRNEEYEKKAIDYIRRKLPNPDKETSVRPGINDSYLDPNLDVDNFIKRFEVESREIFASRHEVIRACRIQSGWHVADIGAGTGLFTRLFSPTVGNEGCVFAVDISPRLLQHVRQQVHQLSLENVTPVLCAENSINLPANSIDLAFVCDTYHHFEYPQSSLRSIYRALKPGGRLIVIDFKRIPGKSREFILGHVRAGQEVFRSEIEQAGFKFIEELAISGFDENYFMRFAKP